ncbi:MAG: ABC transporter ATP-binding protein [Bacillota bacterium]
MEKLLQVKNLETSFMTYAGEVHAVRGVSFNLDKGETLAIVGESGCGKTVTAQSIMRLIPMPPGVIKEGSSIRFDGVEITALSEREMQKIRGHDMGMIFQDPMTSLNPTMTIERQIAEGIIKHQHLPASQARERVLQMLSMVGIPNPTERMNSYPHQFSGGMRQRVMIAMALACNPKLLIADEPTTALDVTIQAQILDLLRELQSQLNTAIIVITHNLGIVANLAQRVMVMYAGKVVEEGPVDTIYYHPKHPYTWALLKSVPRLDYDSKEELAAIPGTPPDLFSPPEGCGFAARCPYAMKVCFRHQPETSDVGDEHTVACWLLHPYAVSRRQSLPEVSADAR